MLQTLIVTLTDISLEQNQNYAFLELAACTRYLMGDARGVRTHVVSLHSIGLHDEPWRQARL